MTVVSEHNEAMFDRLWADWVKHAEGSAYSTLEVCSQQCESEIERRLLPALIFMRPKSFHLGYGGSFGPADVNVRPQRRIGPFRVDFAVTAARNWDKRWPQGKVVRLVVECDGHDFHERTKEQARRDRRRDRMLMLGGWKVVRFTGSEIWADAVGCAQQVADLLDTLGSEIAPSPFEEGAP